MRLRRAGRKPLWHPFRPKNETPLMDDVSAPSFEHVSQKNRKRKEKRSTWRSMRQCLCCFLDLLCFCGSPERTSSNLHLSDLREAYFVAGGSNLNSPQAGLQRRNTHTTNIVIV